MLLHLTIHLDYLILHAILSITICFMNMAWTTSWIGRVTFLHLDYVGLAILPGHVVCQDSKIVLFHRL